MIVRETQKPREFLTELPMWVKHLLANIQAYADFVVDMERGIARCEALVSDWFAKGEDRKAAIALGKRDALREVLNMVDSYRREEEDYARRRESGTDATGRWDSGDSAA